MLSILMNNFKFKAFAKVPMRAANGILTCLGELCCNGDALRASPLHITKKTQQTVFHSISQGPFHIWPPTAIISNGKLELIIVEAHEELPFVKVGSTLFPPRYQVQFFWPANGSPIFYSCWDFLLKQRDHYTRTPNDQRNRTKPNILASLPLPWILVACGAFALSEHGNGTRATNLT